MAAPGAANAAPANSGPIWTNPVSSKSSDATSKCADYLFVGVRGSGENNGFGSSVGLIRNYLISGAAASADERRSGSAPVASPTIRSVYIDYTAAPVPSTLALDILFASFKKARYFDSIQDGVGKLNTVLDSSWNRCKGSEKWMLAGYSQGAIVVNQVLGNTIHTNLVRNVSTIGDPDTYDGRDVYQYGSAYQDGSPSGPVRGVYDHVFRIPARKDIHQYSVSFCNAGDLICDFDHATAGLAVHKIAHGLKVHSSYTTSDQHYLRNDFEEQGSWLAYPFYKDSGLASF